MTFSTAATRLGGSTRAMMIESLRTANRR